MANAMRVSNYLRPVNLLEIAQQGSLKPRSEEDTIGGFKEMFSRELADNRSVNFSKHASRRLFSRNIELNEGLIQGIADAIDKAEEKGSKETLILTDDAALIVSIRNRTVVTAFDRDNLRSGVVTSIDSAVIL